MKRTQLMRLGVVAKRVETALWETLSGLGSQRKLLVMAIRMTLLSWSSGTPAMLARSE